MHALDLGLARRSDTELGLGSEGRGIRGAVRGRIGRDVEGIGGLDGQEVVVLERWREFAGLVVHKGAGREWRGKATGGPRA